MQARARENTSARSVDTPAGTPHTGLAGPAGSDVDLLLSLQRDAGNAAVASMLSQRRGAPLALQREPPAAKPEQARDARDVAAYNETRRRHDHNRSVIQGWLKDGATQKDDRRLRNSCEWANTGRSKVYVVTKTHDSRARSAAAGHSGGAAWFSFPTGEISAATSYYARRAAPADPWDNTNIHFEDSDTADGFSNTAQGVIAVMETVIDRGARYFHRVLKHEVQHAADDHGTTPLENYKTEFRAFWLGSGEFNSESATDRVRNMGWVWNARQWAIFDNLYNDPVYGYVKTAWDAEDSEPDHSKRTFQHAVVSFSRPESINPENSIHVDDFYHALQATSHADCTAESPAQPNPNVTVLRAALGKLEAADRHDIQGNRLFDGILTTHLAGTVLDEIRAALAR
jgi:hypothetical protein